ncbi:MAG: hypothetical protein V8R49_00930 [Duodenibacillus massiliensis]
MTANTQELLERLRNDAADREIVGCIVRRSVGAILSASQGKRPADRPEREREAVKPRRAAYSVLNALPLDLVLGVPGRLEARPSVAYLDPGDLHRTVVSGSNIELNDESLSFGPNPAVRFTRLSPWKTVLRGP